MVAHDRSNILRVFETLEELSELEKLGVIRIVEPRFDRYSVVHLVTERVRRVVHENSFCEVTSENIQVFEVVPFNQKARVSKEAVLDEFVLRVDQVEERVRVNLLRRREYYHFEFVSNRTQESVHVRAQFHSNTVLHSVEINGENKVRVRATFDAAVNEGLVEVKNERHRLRVAGHAARGQLGHKFPGTTGL